MQGVVGRKFLIFRCSCYSSILSLILRNMKRKFRKEGSREIGVVMKILFSNKEKCFSTCAKELRKAKKILRCHVKVQNGAPDPSHASEIP